jgi:hypothetical protein
VCQSQRHKQLPELCFSPIPIRFFDLLDEQSALEHILDATTVRQPVADPIFHIHAKGLDLLYGRLDIIGCETTRQEYG